MKRSLSTLGLASGLSIFVGINLYTYHIAVPCCDERVAFGFPLQYGTFGGFLGTTDYRIDLLFLNYVIGILASAVFAVFIGRLVPPIESVVGQIYAWHAKTRLS